MHERCCDCGCVAKFQKGQIVIHEINCIVPTHPYKLSVKTEHELRKFTIYKCLSIAISVIPLHSGDSNQHSSGNTNSYATSTHFQALCQKVTCC